MSHIESIVEATWKIFQNIYCLYFFFALYSLFFYICIILHYFFCIYILRIHISLMLLRFSNFNISILLSFSKQNEFFELKKFSVKFCKEKFFVLARLVSILFKLQIFFNITKISLDRKWPKQVFIYHLLSFIVCLFSLQTYAINIEILNYNTSPIACG